MQRQNNDQTAGKCQINGTKKEMGGLGEVIFIGIIEFDPSFKGSLTCVWRKGSGRSKEEAIHSSLHSADLSIMCQTLF